MNRRALLVAALLVMCVSSAYAITCLTGTCEEEDCENAIVSICFARYDRCIHAYGMIDGKIQHWYDCAYGPACDLDIFSEATSCRMCSTDLCNGVKHPAALLLLVLSPVVYQLI